MKRWDRQILNTLLDQYERSLLYRGENRVIIHIVMKVTPETVPEYFDQSSDFFDFFHECLYELEKKEFIGITWRNNETGHIVEKIIMNTEKAPDIYSYLKRTPKAVYIRQTEELLGSLAAKCHTPVAGAFIAWLRERITKGLSVKEFIDISDIAQTKMLISCVNAIERNENSCYFREFSIVQFGDSKAFECIKGRVKKVFCRFGTGMEDMDEKEIFSEYGIYDTPDFVYLKGEGILHAGRGILPLRFLKQGMGISGDDLDGIYIEDTGCVSRVITIENLTTFFRWDEPASLIIYLGGYHNHSRRKLLNIIYNRFPKAAYLHFGDIDAGGFAIYEDLCRKTGILFTPYRMGIPELEAYRAYTRPLSAGDRKRLELMLNGGDGKCLYADVIRYMLANDLKLEQECIGAIEKAAGSLVTTPQEGIRQDTGGADKNPDT